MWLPSGRRQAMIGGLEQNVEGRSTVGTLLLGGNMEDFAPGVQAQNRARESAPARRLEMPGSIADVSVSRLLMENLRARSKGHRVVCHLVNRRRMQ
jgi:hypothetical protein